jgi:hypothetical protein
MKSIAWAELVFLPRFSRLGDRDFGSAFAQVSYRVFLIRAGTLQIAVPCKRLKWSLIVTEKHG